MSEGASTAGKNEGGWKHRLWFAYIVFLILWGGSVYNWLGGEIAKHELFARVIEGHPYVSDFVNVYNSASLAAACEKEKIDIYSPEIQNEFAKKLTAPVVPEQPFYLQYPPFLFASVRFLAYFDLLGAWLVWCGLGLVLFVISTLALIGNRAGCESGQKPSRFTLTFIVAAALASFPTWLSVELGQTSLPLVPGLVAFWICCRKRKYFLAGLASGVVMVKLQYLPPVFIIGFLLGTCRYLAGFGCVGAALMALSVWILGIDNVLRFPQALLKGESSQGVSGVAADQMQNLRGNLVLLLGNDGSAVHIIALGAFALAMCAIAFLWWHYRRSQGNSKHGSRYRVLAAISTLLMLALSPHCHTQDYLALVIPCIWLWFEIVRIKRTQLAKADTTITKDRLVSWLQGLILMFPLLGWPFFVLRFLFQLAKIQPFFIWAVVVCGLSFHLLRLVGNDAGADISAPATNSETSV